MDQFNQRARGLHKCAEHFTLQRTFLTAEHSLRAAGDKGGPDYVHRFFRYVFTGDICDEARGPFTMPWA